jgi:hypothetical protein
MVIPAINTYEDSNSTNPSLNAKNLRFSTNFPPFIEEIDHFDRKTNQKSHSRYANDLFDGECPSGDSNSLFQIDPETRYWTRTKFGMIFI